MSVDEVTAARSMIHLGQPEAYEGMKRDPVPHGGYPPLQRRPNVESDFNEENWPESEIPVSQTIRKTAAKNLFKLTIEDMCGLYYRSEYGPPPRDSGPRRPRLVEYKIYFKSDCERRAWEVHGGPTGLAMVQRGYAIPKSASKSASKSEGSSRTCGGIFACFRGGK